MAWHSLGRLLDSAVRVESLELLLDSYKRIRELAVVQDDDRLLDPLQKVGRKRLVFLDHLFCFDGVIEHLDRMMHRFLLLRRANCSSAPVYTVI